MNPTQICKDIVKESGFPGQKLKPGMICRHPKVGLVQILDGQFLRNGRVSNWWTWRRFVEGEGRDFICIPKEQYSAWGSWGPEESGYGWDPL